MPSIKTLLKPLRAALPGKYILLESAPDVADNTKPVFDELLRRGFNNKYKLVWVCSDARQSFPAYKNVYYLYPKASRLDKLRWGWAVLRAKGAVSCNEFLSPSKPNAVSFYLSHGTTVKDVGHYYIPPKRLQLFLGASEESADVLAKLFKIPREQVVGLGFPRNDVLSQEPLDLHPFFPEREFERLIVWYPTFRQHMEGWKTGAPHALPVIWDEQRAEALNACARACRVLIVVKPHFVQDVSVIKKLNLSHLVFIDDSFFIKNKLSSYRFVGSCDAMLTDYSSIYYDFTLCDKPIGLTWEDYEEYAQNPGFAVDMADVMKGGEKIYTLDELKAFVRSVAAGEDRLKAERREIRDRFNISTDGKNTQRVTDFIIERFGL